MVLSSFLSFKVSKGCLATISLKGIHSPSEVQTCCTPSIIVEAITNLLVRAIEKHSLKISRSTFSSYSSCCKVNYQLRFKSMSFLFPTIKTFLCVFRTLPFDSQLHPSQLFSVSVMRSTKTFFLNVGAFTPRGVG
ncbi:hypothetical protein NIES4075_70100 [Tolypothrix sp. NIES-4075]|nr:hypothetical protein NIES4075_70100 [Tolypothrix sp. NIES-4075]